MTFISRNTGPSPKRHKENDDYQIVGNNSLFSPSFQSQSTDNKTAMTQRIEAFYTILGLTYARGKSGDTHVVRANGNAMFVYIL